MILSLMSAAIVMLGQGPLRATERTGAHVPVIATGWDSPDCRQFRQGLAKFEAWNCFDGTTLRALRRTPKGAEEPAIYAFGRERWEWRQFAPALVDLKAAHPARCRWNFVMLYSNPGDVDWFDDAGWREVVNHWRLLARLAKRGGLAGILYDAEPYTPPHSQFLYSAQAGRAKHSFVEYQAMARRRGREVMRAVADEYPDAVIFAYRIFSDMLGLLDNADRQAALEADTYGLQPAFIDGWLDAMPAGLRVIEGTEDIGYRANSPADYNGAFTRLKLRMADFVSAGNREKLRRQFLVGQSMYLDAYVNPPGNPWHIPREGTTAAARLAANLGSAMAASDGLVWLYGEKGRWWDAGDLKYPTWPVALPGALKAIHRVRDPQGFAANYAASVQPEANVLPNPAFAVTAPDGVPTGWFPWQDDRSHGKIGASGGSVVFSGVTNGVLDVEVPVKTDGSYVVRARCRSEGGGRSSLFVAWKAASGAWTAVPANRRLMPSGPADAQGWRTIVGMVDVPAGAAKAVFMVASTGGANDGDRCWFRDVMMAGLVD